MIRDLNLKARWEDTWERLRAGFAPQDVFDKSIKAYSAPERFFHSLYHIQDCLSVFDLARSAAIHPEVVELGIWFHDAVYDTRRSDNEEKSAAWAASVVIQAGLDAEIAKRVSRSILATRHNQEVTDMDARMLVDVDLSILGREPDLFWTYEENIRKEYAWVTEDLFKRERIKILRRFLERPYIYTYGKYRELFEGQARVNLGQAIAKLSDTTSPAR